MSGNVDLDSARFHELVALSIEGRRLDCVQSIYGIGEEALTGLLLAAVVHYAALLIEATHGKAEALAYIDAVRAEHMKTGA